MAIPWLTLIKVVPWTDVIANAPKVVEGAKKLWGSAHRAGAGSGGKTVSGPTYATEPAPGREGEGVALLRSAVARLSEALGADAPAAIYLKGFLGAALADAGDRVEAEAVLADAAARAARVYGSAAPETKFIEGRRARLAALSETT